MKKIFSFIAVVICVGILVGCGATKLSDKYSEEALKASTETVIKNMDSGNFKEIENMMADKLKETVPADKLKEVWDESFSKVGKYEKLSKIVFQEKNGCAVVVAIAKFENSNVQYTLSYDKDMKLVGLYIK